MTAPTEGTAVALTADQRDDKIVGRLPAALQHALNLRKLANIAASKLAATSWGKDVDEGTRRAIAGWCNANDVDPATEFELLGNKFYKNAAWHLRKLGELAERGVVEYAVADHVQNDLRLLALTKSSDPVMAQWAREEDDRRTRERVSRNIPDEATGACLFRVKLWSMASEIVGVAWSGGGTKSKVVSGGEIKNSDRFDPIGTAEPTKSAESRAARRAIRMLATARPDVTEELERGMGEVAPIQARVKADHDMLKAQRSEHVQIPIKAIDANGEDAPRLPAGAIRETVITDVAGRGVKSDHPLLEGPDPFASELDVLDATVQPADDEDDGA